MKAYNNTVRKASEKPRLSVNFGMSEQDMIDTLKVRGYIVLKPVKTVKYERL
jgi:hypothetical protein